MKPAHVFAVIACLLVIAGIVAGFTAIGPPSHARLVALDERRVDDLKDIASRLRTRYRDMGAFPATLPSIWARDPETKQAYEYRLVDKDHFTLCAVFNAPTENEDYVGTSFWRHGTGKKCYAFDKSTEPVL